MPSQSKEIAEDIMVLLYPEMVEKLSISPALLLVADLFCSLVSKFVHMIHKGYTCPLGGISVLSLSAC